MGHAAIHLHGEITKQDPSDDCSAGYWTSGRKGIRTRSRVDERSGQVGGMAGRAKGDRGNVPRSEIQAAKDSVTGS